MDDRALSELLADGHQPGADGLLAVHDGHGDRLFGYALSLLGTEDAAAGAVRDALLVAAERIAVLTEPDRLRPWLYALTRNECVRRVRPGGADDPDREFADLATRHLLAPDEVAAVLGLTLTETTDRLRTVRPPAEPAEPAETAALAPPELREQLVGAAAPDAAGYRAAVSRRAEPFGPDGFPRPLDQRRITGRAVAWLTTAAVLIALGLLVVLPGHDSAADPALAAQAARDDAAAPGLTSPPQPSFGNPNAWPIPAADTLRPATSPAWTPPAQRPAGRSTRRPSVTTAAPGAATVAPRSLPPSAGPAVPPADGGSGPAVQASFQNRTAPACGFTWTAEVDATVTGLTPAAVSAHWTSGSRSMNATLRLTGGEWVGTLRDLPTRRPGVLVVQAVAGNGQSVQSAPRPIYYDCS